MVNSAILDGRTVTILDPIGLYISEVNIAGLSFNGQDVSGDVLRVVRGTDQGLRKRILRFELALPSNAAYTLDQCVLGTDPITTGGPIARQTTIAIYAGAVASAAPPRAVLSCVASALCEHPDHAGFFSHPRLDASGTERCDLVDWANRVPFTGARAPQPLLAGAGVADVVARFDRASLHDRGAL